MTTPKKSITHRTINDLVKIIEVVSIRDTKNSIWVKPLKTETDEEGLPLAGADGHYLYKRDGRNFALYFTKEYNLSERVTQGTICFVEYDEILSEREGKLSKVRFVRDLTIIRTPKEGDKE